MTSLLQEYVEMQRQEFLNSDCGVHARIYESKSRRGEYLDLGGTR